MIKQIKFRDIESNEIHGGLLLEDGSVLCGCCGSLIEADEVGIDDEGRAVDIAAKIK